MKSTDAQPVLHPNLKAISIMQKCVLLKQAMNRELI
jgi:hypothetical protein